MNFRKIKRGIIKRLYFLYKTKYGKFGYHSIIESPFLIDNKKKIFLGDNSIICKGARIECFSNYLSQKFSPKLIVGNHVCVGYNFTCFVTSTCCIGDNTLIASNVLITTENHGMNPDKPYVDQELISCDVNIGCNCWIGEKAIILPGVSIGNNSIIGAGSVVTKSIPDYSIAVGNPAKVIKQFDAKTKMWKKV